MIKACFLALCWAIAGSAAAEAPLGFADLPFDLAVTEVRGNGLRAFASFEDPNCGYCKRMDADLADLDDVTIYTFMFPVLAPDSSDKAKAVWCAPNRAKAWHDWMLYDIAPRRGSCDARAIERLIALGRKLKLRATPTVILPDGARIVGTVSKMELELAISTPQAMAAHAEALKKAAARPPP